GEQGTLLATSGIETLERGIDGLKRQRIDMLARLLVRNGIRQFQDAAQCHKPVSACRGKPMLLLEPTGNPGERGEELFVYHRPSERRSACNGKACLDVAARETLGDALPGGLFQRFEALRQAQARLQPA